MNPLSATDLTAFLAARLDEDEAAAKRAAACGLVQRDGFEPGDWSWLSSYGQPQPEQIALIDHQARFDPARVLRDVEAMRSILAAYIRIEGDGHRDNGWIAFRFTVEALAAVYADHPDYRPEWTP